jgi:hypothetical protein
MLIAALASWDVQTKENCDRNLEFDETIKIAAYFKTNVDKISRKMKPLKTKFSQERQKNWREK